jgi:hypothetical protein
MTKVRVNGFALSLDGYGAGPDQSLEYPLGVGGSSLHEWAYGARSRCKCTSRLWAFLRAVRPPTRLSIRASSRSAVCLRRSRPGSSVLFMF